ncbi:hypothetical protein [Xenorhabdus cabanillasii]|nr:hypothetical protein [Xenorhabdus cabanillasii]
MPRTAKEWGLVGNDVLNPYKSADAAARYLHSLVAWENRQHGGYVGSL